MTANVTNIQKCQTDKAHSLSTVLYVAPGILCVAPGILYVAPSIICVAASILRVSPGILYNVIFLSFLYVHIMKY